MGQIVREVSITKETNALNESYQEALFGTVWANYQLVGSQWTNPQTEQIYPQLLSNIYPPNDTVSVTEPTRMAPIVTLAWHGSPSSPHLT